MQEPFIDSNWVLWDRLPGIRIIPGIVSLGSSIWDCLPGIVSLGSSGQDPLPETLDALRGLVFETCEKLLKEAQEKKDYADKCRAANEKYERDKEDKLIEEEKEECRKRNEWVKQREQRVSSWRDYQEGLKKKEINHQAFTGLRHVREERKDEDLIKKRQKVQGIDNSYKLNWR
ncbi:hypothetical protein Emag_006006 [Eimeria magna]